MAVLKTNKKRNIRKKMTKATSLFLDYIIRQYGGIRAVAKKTGFSPQLINWWIQCGEVPVKRVGKLVDLLEHALPEHFNYEACASIDEGVFDFKKLVEDLVKETSLRKKILTAEQPRSRSELLS